MHLRRTLLSLLLIGFALTAIGETGIAANAPERIDYQGILIRNGTPVTTEVEVIFRIYATETGGSVIWDETQMVTPDGDGRFNVELGTVDRLHQSVFDSPSRWMSLEIEREGEMAPRTHFTSVPYAYRVETLDGSYGGYVGGDITLQGDLQVNGDVIMPVGSISSDEIANEAGIDYISGGVHFLPDYDTSLIVLAVNCPSSGYVFAMASARVTLIHSGATTTQAVFGISDTPNSMPANQDQSIRLSSSMAGGTYHFPVTAQAGFSVSPGIHYVYFIGRLESGTSGIQSVSGINMAAFFYPTSY